MLLFKRIGAGCFGIGARTRCVATPWESANPAICARVAPVAAQRRADCLVGVRPPESHERSPPTPGRACTRYRWAALPFTSPSWQPRWSDAATKPTFSRGLERANPRRRRSNTTAAPSP